MKLALLDGKTFERILDQLDRADLRALQGTARHFYRLVIDYKYSNLNKMAGIL